MPKYRFDVKLFANIVIETPNRPLAVDAIEPILKCMDLTEDTIGGINSELSDRVKVLRVGISEDGEEENRDPIDIE